MSAFTFVDLPAHGRVSRDKEPNLCPHCSHKVVPDELAWHVSGQYADPCPKLESVYRCTNTDCNHLFVAVYKLVAVQAKTQIEELTRSLGGQRFRFDLDYSIPKLIPNAAFPPEVQSISSSFVEIFHQAEEAEAHDLSQICGLGYRKSIEYLIKDFCITTNAADADRIKSMALTQCINEFIDDERIKDCAKRATWLGNDEAHYVRKWVDRDISDLKLLIRLTCIWIESFVLTARYRDEMK